MPSPSAKPKQPSRLRRRLGLAAAGLLVALIVAEVLVRVAALAPSIDPHMSWLIADDHLPYKPKPGSHIRGKVPSGEYQYDHRHNSLGFRDSEHDTKKPPGTFRILGVGDSFTAGWGAPFEQTYLRRLELALAARDGDHPRIEVIKAGISGYFPQTEKLVVEHYGLQFQPDVIIVGFLPNDVLDTMRGLESVVVDKQGYLTSAEAADLGAFGLWLYRTSHVARIALRAWVKFRQRDLPPDWWMPIYEPNEEFEAAWLELEHQYDGIRTLAQTAGAKLVVLNIPESVPDQSFHAYPAKRLAAWCGDHDVTFIDAAPQVLAASQASQDPLYYSEDRHCTPAGYQAVADALLAGLVAADLIP